MPRFAQVARVSFASGMVSLGVMGLVCRDFAAVWGPVPHAFPQSAALAVVCALVALGAGAGLLFRRTAPAASLVTVAYVALWWLLLKATEVVRAPGTELSWLDCGMFGMLLAGAWTVAVDLGGKSRLSGGARGRRLARLFFGLCLIPTGLSHFVYLRFTVPLIPKYFPIPVAWAYLTGSCHLAAGLGILTGVRARLAAHLEAAMLLIFTVLVWVPRVIAAPSMRGNWTEIWLSWALTAAAAVVAGAVPLSSPRASPAR